MHGGPGDACIPLTQKYNADLAENFIFVNLDQRGCGLSYYPFSQEEPLTIEWLLEDVHQFVRYLLERFQQTKLILMGHSWGSVLGMLFIQKYPQLVAQYIGVGQVVNMEKNIHYQLEFLKGRMKNYPELEQLNFAEDSINASMLLTKKIVKHGGSLYDAKNYRRLILPFVFSKEYSLSDLLHRLQGSKQSINAFWQELMAVNFESQTNFAVPLTFCEGRHDYHVSSTLLANYAQTIQTENQLVWFEQSGHFPQWEEAKKFNQVIANLLKQ